MDALANAAILIFCTPLGWIGMMAFGFSLSMIIESWKGKKN